MHYSPDEFFFFTGSCTKAFCGRKLKISHNPQHLKELSFRVKWILIYMVPFFLLTVQFGIPLTV